MAVIHVTERARFKGCRRSWHFQDKECLQRPVDRMDARWIGRGIHAGLAGYYLGKDPIVSFHDWLDAKLSQSEHDATVLEEIVTLVGGILLGYIEYARANDSFDVVAVEESFTVPIPGTRNRLVGTLDLVVRDRGKLWVIDHKSVRTFVSPDTLDLDDQMTAYLYLVWKHFGEMPKGAIYNQLRKKLPVEPLLLKSGQALSRDKSIDTTTEKYLAAIRAHGFDSEEYADILEKVACNEFFRREIIPRNTNELQTFEENLVFESREMASKQTPIYPNPSRDCIYCDYIQLCKAQNERGDVESLKKALFVVEAGRRL